MADIVISDAAPNAAIDDLIGKIVSLDKMKTLFAIADMGKFVSQQETPNPTINRWNLSVFAHLLITRRSSQHTHVPTGDELTHICRLISGIPQYAKFGLVNPKGEPVVAHGTILAALLRTAFSQFPLNIRHLQEIARNGVSFDEAIANSVRGRYGDIDVSFIGRIELIKNKRASGRDQDLVDAKRLEKNGQQ